LKTRIFVIFALLTALLSGQVAQAGEITGEFCRVYAVHEAGHAGFALMFPKSITLNGVYIIKSPTDEERGRTNANLAIQKGNEADIVRAIAMAFAGEAAEELVLGRITPNSSKRDKELAAKLVKENLGESADLPRLLDAGRTLAHEVLSMHYANINRLADALCDRTSLTGQEAKDIWE
jgi:ATP-dependent Zn protease